MDQHNQTARWKMLAQYQMTLSVHMHEIQMARFRAAA